MKADSPKIVFDKIWGWVGSVSVRTKIFGIVLASSILLSFSFIYQVRVVLHNLLSSESYEQGISIARDVAARATDLVLINDLYSLHQLLMDTQSNFHDVRYVVVIAKDGSVLGHTFGNGFPLDLLDKNAVSADQYQHSVVLQTEEGLVWDVAVPIFEGRAGMVRVGISDQSVRSALAALTSQMTLTLLLVLSFSLLAATFLTWVLTRPILELVQATKSIAASDFSVRLRRWADDEIGDLADAFNQMAKELSRIDELRRERETLRRQLLEGFIQAQEDERQAISRELHDSTSQTLTSLMLGLRMLAGSCQDPQVQSQAEDLRQVAAQTLDDVHQLSVSLRPAILDDLGLSAALDRYFSDWQTRNEIPLDAVIHVSEQRLPGTVETTLYRVVQEALTNISRHAQATQVSVLIEQHSAQVVAVIEDNGRGFDTDKITTRRLGLLGMRERAELLGGNLQIESRIGHGTSLFVHIPLATPSLFKESG